MEKPLFVRQQVTLQIVEKILKNPRLRIKFKLKPGQILLTNNHWILHNRTSFKDLEIIEKQRHLIRLWPKREILSIPESQF